MCTCPLTPRYLLSLEMYVEIGRVAIKVCRVILILQKSLYFSHIMKWHLFGQLNILKHFTSAYHFSTYLLSWLGRILGAGLSFNAQGHAEGWELHGSDAKRLSSQRPRERVLLVQIRKDVVNQVGIERFHLGQHPFQFHCQILQT